MKWKNIDYIRTMETEELVDFLCDHFNCKPEGNCPVECEGSDCKEHIKQWLQQERKAD